MTRKERIQDALQRALSPSHLEVVDESHQHSVKPGAESHFKLIVTSGRFAGCSPVARQRLVYGALQHELASGLHALTMSTFTEAEWALAPAVPASPPCAGGSKAG